MSRERRIRDKDGGSIYYNIDESDEERSSGAGAPSVHLPCTSGAGVFDTMKNVASSIATKLTGKAAKKIAEKAIEKGAEKVGEKTGEKLGVLLGEKIYDRFRGDNPRKGELAPQPGDKIIKELQREQKELTKKSQKGKKPPPGEAFALSQQFKNNQELSTKSISEQFYELLAL